MNDEIATNPQPPSMSAEIRIVRRELLDRGLRTRDMAALVGVSMSRFVDELSRGVSTRWVRDKIEAVFDYKVPIWSDPAKLRRRQHCHAVFGFDPCLFGKEPLVQQLKARGIPFPGEGSYAQIADAALDAAAVKPPPKPAPVVGVAIAAPSPKFEPGKIPRTT